MRLVIVKNSCMGIFQFSGHGAELVVSRKMLLQDVGFSAAPLSMPKVLFISNQLSSISALVFHDHCYSYSYFICSGWPERERP